MSNKDKTDNLSQGADSKKLPNIAYDIANIATAIVDKNIEDEMTLTVEEEASIYSGEPVDDSTDPEAASNIDDLLKEIDEEDGLIPCHVNSYQDEPNLERSSRNSMNGQSERTHLVNGHHQQDGEPEEDTRRARWLKKALGFFLALLSGIMFTTNNFIIKGYNVVSTDLILVRSVLQIIFLGVLIKIHGVQFWPLMTRKQSLLMVVQGMLGGVSMVGTVAAVTLMPVADALTIIFSNPLVTIILAAIFLGDRLTFLKVVAGLSLTVGVVLVCRPPFLFHSHLLHLLLGAPHNKEYWIGVSVSATVALSSGVINVLVSQLKTVPSVVLVWWAGLGGLLLSLCAAPLDSDSKIPSSSIVDISLSSWLLMVGLSISGLLAYLAMTHSLQLISPTLVASLRALEIVLSYLVQTALSGISPSPLSCGGGALVTLGVLTVALESPILKRWRLIRWRSQYQQL